MPLIEASFRKTDGFPDGALLQLAGPTIMVSVCTMAALPTDPTTCETVHALIDSGACVSMIDSALAAKLGLVEVDKANCSGVSGPSVHSVYMASIQIPQLDYHQFGKFMAANLTTGGQPHGVLLGRDFLANTVMIYDGVRAQVTLASAKK